MNQLGIISLTLLSPLVLWGLPFALWSKRIKQQPNYDELVRSPDYAMRLRWLIRFWFLGYALVLVLSFAIVWKLGIL